MCFGLYPGIDEMMLESENEAVFYGWRVNLSFHHHGHDEEQH